ncbi:uncharacterized protein JCM6883_002625 [Sporobolomyces salmoneus]|uniref:uncharacterized protein n=1 Tax=Sporobolomyces salmoneus TaxID=183962 RepID=UPI0031797B7C
MAQPPNCVPTPISTIFETTTVTSLVPTTSGSTTYVLVDPQAEVVSTTFRTRNGLLEPVRTTVTGATVTTTEALTVTQTSLVVTSTPVSTILNSCPVGPTSSSVTSSSTLSSSTSSSTTTTSSSTTASSTTTSSTTSSTQTSSSSSTSSSVSSSQISSSSLSSASASSSTGLLPSNASNASNSSSSSPSNLAAIIGGSVGGGVGAIILLGLLLWCCCGRNRRKGKDHDEWRDPAPFLGANAHSGSGGGGGGSGEFEEKEATTGGRWDPAATSSGGGGGGNTGRLSRKFVGAGAGAALAGGVSAYDRGGNQNQDAVGRRKSRKTRPADEQDAYYRNTWVQPTPQQPEVEAPRDVTPVSAGFAGVGAGRGGSGGIAPIASRNVPPQPQRQGTFANMMDNATTFDPRARDGGWAVANEAFNSNGNGTGNSSRAQFQPRNPMPPPAPLPLPGIDYRPNHDTSNNAGPSTSDTFLLPPSQSRFNRFNSPSHHQPQPPATQTNGYDSPAPSHVSIPALGPYLAGSNGSERGGNQLRVTNLGSSTAAGSDWGANSPIDARGGGDWNNNAREEIAEDNDPYGGLDAGLDYHHRPQQQRY